MIGRLSRIWPHRRTLRLLGARYVVVGVLQGCLLLTIVPLLRTVLATPADYYAAARWLGVVGLLGIAYLGAVWWAKSLGYRTANGIMRTLQHDIGSHLARLPLGWYVGNKSGGIARTVAQSTPSASGVVSHVWPELVQSIVTPATVVAGVFLVDWRMGIAFLVTVPAAMVVNRWSGPVVRDTQAIMDAASADAAGRAIEFAQAQPVLRATGRAMAGFGPLERALDEQRRTFRAALTRHTMPQLVYVAVVQIGFTIVLVTGTWLARRDSLTVAEAVALLVLAARFVEPLAQIGNLFGTIRVADVAIERVSEVLTAAPLAEPDATVLPSATDIAFDDVWFAYDGRPVLRGLNLRMPAGAMTALVGPSGAGKTTILRLVSRFWDVDRGAVRVGGTDVRDLTSADLMSHIAIVFQDTYLFDGTIEENVRLAAPNATDGQVREAMVTARLDEVVERLPGGWDTRVGEGGMSLSGGERQRVAIARALVKDAPIVLLDEITAALDPENEAAVAAGVATLAARGKTIVVIAHRLSTIARADRIAVLDGGEVVELGTHDELIARGGRYAGFYARRSQATGWQLSRSRA
ncbi:ABC transporter ATP-binding protein [Micromonospora sp. CPCC 206061]|uniref:ABC transporter ATP-binding protein n=1 Tax=Micromonospora sp. CPCC 206061 TaxID=3122410 RepID=UPI002FF189EC